MRADVTSTSGPTRTLAVVSISGGKDSTATALLALEGHARSRCRFVFADTGNEHEETLAYVLQYLPTVLGTIETVRADFTRDIARKREFVKQVWPLHGVPEDFVRRTLEVLHPTGIPFLDLCLWKGRFPSRMAQFCTQSLKRIPLDGYLLDRLDEGFEVESWRGIRRDESIRRRMAPDRERVAEGFEIVHPIAAWSAQETVDYVVRKGVRLNPLYSQGMYRVGCMPCINCRKGELLEISRRFPRHIDRIREWEQLVSLASKRGWTTFFTDALREGETHAQTFERMRIDARVRWAATTRQQTDLPSNLPPPVCSSVYGLCE